jgi:hypothetical protein
VKKTPLLLLAIGFWICAAALAATNSGPGWSVVASPNDGSDKWNFLDDITCVSVGDCWAIGSHRNSSGYDQTLTEHWDGTTWSIVPSPNSSSQSNYLYAITCLSAHECWAVGRYSNGTVKQTQSQYWDGDSWTIVPFPNVNSQYSALSGVTCLASDSCWAVGSYDTGSSYQALIGHWDGNSWSIVPPPGNSQGTGLAAVTCISEADCWAVGSYGNGSGSQPLTEHWDGSFWSTVASPITSSYAILADIKCTASSDCWAVGYYYTGYGDPLTLTSSQTLVEHWDGTSWSIAPSPDPGSQYNALSAVACSSASDCWSVGYDQNSTGPQGNLVEHWNGNSWSVVTSLTKGAPGLIGVACTSASQCWAVGQYINDSAVSQTLIEEFAPTIPPLVSVGSRMTHGSGLFDLDLPIIGTRGAECRNGNGNYSVVSVS